MNEFTFKRPRWVHLELFGRSSYFGLAQEAEVFGGKLGVIYSLSVEGLAEDGMGFGANAIYRITPMPEEVCRRAVLPAPFRVCETFAAAPVLATRCRHCGFTAAEHLQRPALGPSTLARSEPPADDDDGAGWQDREAPLDDYSEPCSSVYRGNDCELDGARGVHEGKHQAFIEGHGTVYWTDEDAARETGPEPHDPGTESSREAQASTLEAPGPDHLRPQ